MAYPWILRGKIEVPYGVMLAFDNESVWGVHRANKMPALKGNTIFGVPRPDPEAGDSALPDFQARPSASKTGWHVVADLRVRSMLRAGDNLFLGGMPATCYGDPASLFMKSGGGKEALIHVVSCRNGRDLEQIKLAVPPVWDGMAAANACLFVSCLDGTVVCLDGKWASGLSRRPTPLRERWT